MRSSRFLPGSFALVLAFLAWSFTDTQSQGSSVDLFADPDETINVVFAVYGGEHASKAEYVDVTDKVTALLQKSPSEFNVSADVLLDKNAPSFDRTILILYNYEQRRYFYNMPDNGTTVSVAKLKEVAKTHPSHIAAIAAPGTPDFDFRIVFATYGVGDTFVDTTDIVRKLLRDQPEGFFAHEDSMGGDPHWGSHKALVIIFDDVAGRHFFAQLNEGPQINKEVLVDSAKPEN